MGPRGGGGLGLEGRVPAHVLKETMLRYRHVASPQIKDLHCSMPLALAPDMGTGEGGETGFDSLGIKVKPQKGSAVIWPNVNPAGKTTGREVGQDGNSPLKILQSAAHKEYSLIV